MALDHKVLTRERRLEEDPKSKLDAFHAMLTEVKKFFETRISEYTKLPGFQNNNEERFLEGYDVKYDTLRNVMRSKCPEFI
ncbi:hypothetical protein J4208_04255 [Candidatus Woesearchaeota archaeon]|nr:hypothetical protein [Candidatus Woesearchaeota archaeon]